MEVFDEFDGLHIDAGPKNNEKYYEKFLRDPELKSIINNLCFNAEAELRPFKPSDIIEGETLNSSVHVVKRCKYDPTGLEIAAKYVPLRQDRYGSSDESNSIKLKKLLTELGEFKKLINHQNIVKFYGLGFHDDQVLICMELMDFSLRDLYTTFHQVNYGFPEELVGCMVESMISALRACQNYGLNHRMVKPSNIFFSVSRSVVKLGDFGEARILHDSMTSTFSGTLAYWPPERFTVEYHDNLIYNTGFNIWGLGITLVEIIVGKLPYQSKGKVTENIILLQHQIKQFQAGVNDLVNRTPFNEYTQMLREFIQRCLSPVITNRTYEMLMETDFYNNSKEPSESIVNKYIEEYNSKNRELNTIVERGMTAPPTALKKLENNPKEVYEQETFTINIDDVKELRTIYARRNTQVIEGSYELGDGRMLAIKKRFFKSHTTKPQDKKDRFLYEIKICKKLIKSPFITYLYAYDIKDTEASLCMELMDMNLKELYQKFHARSNSFPEKLLGCILYSVLNALSYCHKNEVVHCDLKPTNILINKGGRIKLTDFGSAIDLNKPYDRIGGTMAYWPRELTNDEKARLNPKRDIWSLGITLSESLLGRLPYLKQGEHPPEGYEVFKYLIKIDDAKDFTDIGNPFEDFIEQSPFYSEFTRVGYTISVIKFISECLQFVDDIPSLDKLQEMDFYRTCPTDRDEVFRITKSYLDELLDVPNIATLGFRSDLSPHDQTQIFDTQEETETDDSLLVPLKCDELLLSIRYHCRHFRTFKDLLNEPDKLQQYSKIVHEYYNTKLLTDTPAYKHFSAPKGLAIIINEIEWTPKPEKKRFGSEIDAQKMEKLLTDLGYELFQGKILENRTKKDILKHLKAFAKHNKHGDSCIVVIMAHGNANVVYDINGNQIHIKREIIQLFDGEHAENLREKPKLFIFQSCRDENKDDRVDCLMVDSVAGEVHESDGLCLGKLPESSSKRSTLNSSADIPNYADIFEFYATAPYDVAHRDPQSGSEFINSLCKIFYAHAHRYHFSDMAKRIIARVTARPIHLRRENTPYEIKYQQPQIIESTNYKDFYFFPGVPRRE